MLWDIWLEASNIENLGMKTFQENQYFRDFPRSQICDNFKERLGRLNQAKSLKTLSHKTTTYTIWENRKNVLFDETIPLYVGQNVASSIKHCTLPNKCIQGFNLSFPKEFLL